MPCIQVFFTTANHIFTKCYIMDIHVLYMRPSGSPKLVKFLVADWSQNFVSSSFRVSLSTSIQPLFNLPSLQLHPAKRSNKKIILWFRKIKKRGMSATRNTTGEETRLSNHIKKSDRSALRGCLPTEWSLDFVANLCLPSYPLYNWNSISEI